MKQSQLFGLTKSSYCIFCKIVRKEEPSHIIFENEIMMVFLDNKPLFSGHCLLIPKTHFDDFDKLPLELVSALFSFSQVLSKAIQASLGAHGTFIAVNNKVSQSVPHVHIHIVPRRFKDGLKGFFWPRNSYQSIDHLNHVKTLIKNQLDGYLDKSHPSTNDINKG